MYPMRAAALTVGLLSFGLSVIFLWPTSLFSPALGAALFVFSCIFLGVGDAYATRRRQREWLAAAYGDFENFRASVDTGQLRHLKYTRGASAARRRLRKLYPNLPLELAQQMINEL